MPDEALKKLINIQLNRQIAEAGSSEPQREESANISMADIEKLEKIEIRGDAGTGSQVQSLDAIKYAKNIKEIYIYQFSVSDLSFLQNLNSLENLYLIKVGISDISYLKNLNNLKKLDLKNNKIEDISVLKNLNSLNDVNLSNNRIKDFSALSHVSTVLAQEQSIDLEADEDTIANEFITTDGRHFTFTSFNGGQNTDVAKNNLEFTDDKIKFTNFGTINVGDNIVQGAEFGESYTIYWNVNVKKIAKLYNITVAQNPDAKLTILGDTKRAENDEVTVDVEVTNPNKKFRSLKLTVGSQTYDDNTGMDIGEYKFNMPPGDTIVNAVLEDNKVTSMTIKSEMSNKSYLEGDNLNLDDLVVELTRQDSTTKDIQPVDFAKHNIITEPANNSVLTKDITKVIIKVKDHNDTDIIKEIPITVQERVAPLDSITLKSVATMTSANQTTNIEVTFNPENATNKTIKSWTSSNPDIVSVDSTGKITAHKNGKATITAVAQDGDKTARIEVKVEIPNAGSGSPGGSGGSSGGSSSSSSSGGGGGGGGSSTPTKRDISVDSKTQNGKVELSTKKAGTNEKVELNVSPDKGYKLKSISVQTKKGREIKVNKLSDNKYSFEMPMEEIVVKAEFEKEEVKKPEVNKIESKKQRVVLKIGSTNMIKTENGKMNTITSDVAPFAKDGRTMMPLRYAAEALGLEVKWEQETRTVVMKDGEKEIRIPIDTNKIIVDGKEYIADVMPAVKNGRTFLSISNLAKALGLVDGENIIWNSDTQEVTIAR